MRSKLFFILMMVLLVFSVLDGGRAVRAQAGQAFTRTPATTASAAASQDASSQGEGGLGEEYLILFAVPQLSSGDLPATVSAPEIEKYAARIVARQAEQIRPELARAAASGRLTDLGVRPDRNGMLVRVQDPAVLERIAELPGIQGVYPSAQALTCSTWSANDLKMALQAGVYTPPPGARSAAAGAAGPFIDVYHFGEGNYGNITVRAGAHLAVSLQLTRAGVVVGTGTGITNGAGTYTFYPSTGGCDSLSNWNLLDGDVVEVTAGGTTASTTVVPVDAWLDPTTNTLNGVTAPSRLVNVDLHLFEANPCAETVNSLPTASNGTGAFTQTYADFNRQAYALVWVMDASGSSTYADIHAFDIELGSDRDRFYLHWKSGESVSASLIRNSAAISTWLWTTVPGWYTYYFPTQGGVTIQAGDIIFVTSALGSITFTVTPSTMNMNASTDNISGVAGANRTVIARIYKTMYSACASTGCANTLTDGSGSYSMTAPLDQGDEADVYIYDAERNAQVGLWDYTPYLVAEPIYNDVGVRWINANPLTVTLKNSSNVPKASLNGVYSSSYSPNWFTFPSAAITSGDHIEVTDGTTSIAMTVSSLVSRLNTSSAHLTGTSANGRLKAYLNDYRYGAYFSQPYCLETTVSAGTFDLAFTGSQIGPQDYVDTWLISPEGQYIYDSADAFTVNLGLGTSDVSGTTEIAGSSVTVKLKRSGSTLTTVSGPSNSIRLFALNVGPDVLQVGDVIEVTTTEANSATLTLPNLSINADGPGSRLYGSAPANEPLRVDFKLQTGYDAAIGTGWMTAANGAGQYSLSTVGLLTSNCKPVAPGSGCTTAKALYAFPLKEHAVYISYQATASALADIYEPDNAIGTASTAVFEHHTFDTVDDVDWVRVVVPQADVTAGVHYRLQTLNLGPGLDTVLELYASNGTTLLLSNNDDPTNYLASRIDWVPPAAGTYYLKARPFSSSSTRYCGAVYDLLVFAQRAHMYLPMLNK